MQARRQLGQQPDREGLRGHVHEGRAGQSDQAEPAPGRGDDGGDVGQCVRIRVDLQAALRQRRDGRRGLRLE